MAHHTFLESKHPEAAKNLYYVLSTPRSQIPIVQAPAHGLFSELCIAMCSTMVFHEKKCDTNFSCIILHLFSEYNLMLDLNWLNRFCKWCYCLPDILLLTNFTCDQIYYTMTVAIKIKIDIFYFKKLCCKRKMIG